MLYFSQDYTPHDHRFLAALAGSEHEVQFLRLEDRGRALEQRPVPAAVRTLDWWGGRRRLRGWDFPRARRELRRVLEQERPDLVHAGPILELNWRHGDPIRRRDRAHARPSAARFRTQDLPVMAPALLTASAGFRPLVSMSWGSDLLVGARRGSGKWAARYALRRSDALVCDSREVQARAEALGMPSEAIVRFPWGVDLAHFSPGDDGGLRRGLGWEDQFVALSTRSWEPLLGVDVLVDGFIQAAPRVPELRLLMLGGGSLAPRIQAALERAGLRERVHTAGQVGFDDLPRWYRAADLYLSASRSDGSSVSLLEAMACGLPALVSDIPGNREWIEPEANGWWFPDGGEPALADRLLMAHSERAALPAMGRRARLVAEARADWTENVGRLLKAYKRVAAGRGERAERGAR